jgi:hypothetical protein
LAPDDVAFQNSRISNGSDPHKSDADPDADADSTYHPDADSDSDFYLMQMWIRMRTVSDFSP